MQVRNVVRTRQNIRRYRQIITVLLRYGFDDVVDRIKIEYYIKLGKKLVPKSKEQKLSNKSTAERLRLALEELGPTFVKLGQMLSVRPDLLPEVFINEFQKLQDEVPPFPSKEAKKVIELELTQEISTIFSHFEEKPIAAASLAQVHRATLISGEDVVVKVQRPKIRSIIEADLNILFHLASLIERHIPESELYDPTGVVQEFAKTIRRELDFVREGNNIYHFQRNFESDPTVYVPKVYWELTTEKVLTMEYIGGIKVTELEKLKMADLDRKVIAYNGARAILKEVFEHGFFHGDPHPGNIFVLPDNVIAPIDFGMMGRLDNQLMEAAADLLTAIIKKDIDRIMRVFVEIGAMEDIADERGLKADLTDFLDRYYQVPLFQLNIGKIINEMMEIIREHRIKLPTDLILMARALVLEEGVGRTLDPEFDMIAIAKPYAQKLMLRKFDLRKHLQEFTSTIDDLNRLLKVLPSELRSIITKVKKGELKIKFEHQGLEHLISELDKSSNRLSFSLIIAALIIGSSLIVQLDKGPLLLGFPAIGILGFLVAAILGLWLIIAILRSGKL